jgi:hypothetical protein
MIIMCDAHTSHLYDDDDDDDNDAITGSPYSKRYSTD